jgi:probable F420-dependent oxidoreductase
MPIVDVARAAEARGFTSLFLNEHTHIPVDHSRSQYPGGGPTPETYARFWDPFVSLSFVAAATSMHVGTAVSLVAEHDPIALAKAVATLDVMSGGRFVLGFGWGWNREEFEDHGRAAANRRAAVALEHVAAMRALWSEEPTAFEGDYVRFGPSLMYPKPMRKPGPPVLLGAPGSDRNLERIVRHADGWIPMIPLVLFDDTFPTILRDLRSRWADAGRASDGPHVTCIQLARTPERLAAAIDRAGELGVERIIAYVGELDEAETLATLDQLAGALS